jgi:hypothetical protein
VLAGGVAFCQDGLVEARSGVANDYRETAGLWTDHPTQSLAPGVPALSPGSRALLEPAPGAAAEFMPVVQPGGAAFVAVELTWPAEANAKGLVIELANAVPAQRFSFALDHALANRWNRVGVFDLSGVAAPLFRIATTEELAAAAEDRPLMVVLDALRLRPALDDATGQAAPAPTAFSPFESAAPVENPFETVGAAASAFTPPPAPIAPPPSTTFEASSPFETGTAAPVVPAPGPDSQEIDFGVSMPAPRPEPVVFSVDDFLARETNPMAPADPFASEQTLDSVSIPLPRDTPLVAAPTGTMLEPFAPTTPSTAMLEPLGGYPDPVPTMPSMSPTGATTVDPFAGGIAGATTVPNAPAQLVRDPTRALAVLPGARGEEASERVITSNLPQPEPARSPNRTLAASLITADSTLFAASGRRATYNPLFDEVQRSDDGGVRERVVPIQWAADMAAAREQARREGKRIVLVFYNEGPDSETFSLDVLARAQVAESLNRAVPVRVATATNRDLVARYRIIQTPYVVVLDKLGFTQGHISERKDSTQFLEQLNRLLE